MAASGYGGAAANDIIIECEHEGMIPAAVAAFYAKGSAAEGKADFKIADARVSLARYGRQKFRQKECAIDRGFNIQPAIAKGVVRRGSGNIAGASGKMDGRLVKDRFGHGYLMNKRRICRH